MASHLCHQEISKMRMKTDQDLCERTRSLSKDIEELHLDLFNQWGSSQCWCLLSAVGRPCWWRPHITVLDSVSSKFCICFSTAWLRATLGQFAWEHCVFSFLGFILFENVALQQSRVRVTEGLLSYRKEIRCLS